MQNLSTINAENAECFNEDDKEMIFKNIREMPGGFEKLHDVVLDKLRDWLTSTGKEALENLQESNDDRALLLNNLAELLRNQVRSTAVSKFVKFSTPDLGICHYRVNWMKLSHYMKRQLPLIKRYMEMNIQKWLQISTT